MKINLQARREDFLEALSRNDAIGLGSAPAPGAVAGAPPATFHTATKTNRMVNGLASLPTGEGAGWMHPGRARSPFAAAYSPLSARLPLIKRRHLQAGIMLVECLIYIAVFTVLIGLAFSAFYRTLDSATRLRRNASDIARALQAGERWRHDIRQATGPITIVNADEGPAYALHVPQSSGEVVYFFTGTELLRRPNANAQWSEALAGVKASRAVKDVRNRITAWRWEVELYPGKKKPMVRPLFTFQAVANHQEPP